MTASIHLNLPDEMHRFILERTGGSGHHSTPSDYIRELIQRDIESHAAMSKLRQGMDDFKHGRFSEKSIDDFMTPIAK
jgi:Arc/MetJ-type ribon-helix-helix transcriptional regulator